MTRNIALNMVGDSKSGVAYLLEGSLSLSSQETRTLKVLSDELPEVLLAGAELGKATGAAEAKFHMTIMVAKTFVREPDGIKTFIIECKCEICRLEKFNKVFESIFIEYE